METPAFKDRQGIHDKDGVGTTGKGHKEAREMRESDYGRFKTGNRKEKKNVSYHHGSVSLVFTNKAPVTNGREMLLC